jgi:hypothetical protein
MTVELRERNLIVNDRLEEYDGTTAVVRSEHLTSTQIEFMRWRADRWIKLRHVPVALRHNPSFILRNLSKIIGHTFRGSTIKTVLGLEDQHRAFERYRARRSEERQYI